MIRVLLRLSFSRENLALQTFLQENDGTSDRCLFHGERLNSKHVKDLGHEYDGFEACHVLAEAQASAPKEDWMNVFVDSLDRLGDTLLIILYPTLRHESIGV